MGVNRYDSPDIDFLASAVHDATALHALFADNLGTDCRLITDEDATTARLRSELQNLQTASSAEDVVVIGFSGHGSNTHEIVTYDSDLDNLPVTALPLEELTSLVARYRPGICSSYWMLLSPAVPAPRSQRAAQAPRRPTRPTRCSTGWPAPGGLSSRLDRQPASAMKTPGSGHGL